MISIMLMGYYLWVYMVIRYHGRVWFYCWQRECVVRYIAPSSQNICCHHNINDYNEDNQYPSENQSAVSEDANYNDSASVHVPDIDIPIPEAIVTASDNINNNDVTIAMNEIPSVTPCINNTSNNNNNTEGNADIVVNVTDTVV